MFYSAGWCLATDTQLKLLDRVVSGAGFLTCEITHRRSVAALCMLFKIGCSSMYPLYCTLPVTLVPVLVTGGAGYRRCGAHLYIYAPHR